MAPCTFRPFVNDVAVGLHRRSKPSVKLRTWLPRKQRQRCLRREVEWPGIEWRLMTAGVINVRVLYKKGLRWKAMRHISRTSPLWALRELSSAYHFCLLFASWTSLVEDAGGQWNPYSRVSGKFFYNWGHPNWRRKVAQTGPKVGRTPGVSKRREKILRRTLSESVRKNFIALIFTPTLNPFSLRISFKKKTKN